MGAKFYELYNAYRARFGSFPPVNDLGMYPAPAEAEKMVRDALERGTPITDADFPELPEDVVV